eukprot:scaffold54462_cov46-Prasinocladus_malaysianus.AAC.1
MAFPVRKDDARGGSAVAKLAWLAAAGLGLAGLPASLVFLRASGLNYPGGDAMVRLHSFADECREGTVHVGVDAAMTGVSRYLQHDDLWAYSKVGQPGEEGIPVEELASYGFSCLLSAEEHVP